MRGLWLMLLLLLLAGGPMLRAAEFEYGPRPASPVYDPDRRLPSEITRKLNEELGRIRTHDGADVMVVALADVGGLPPESMARRSATAWGNPLLNAVVLDVANREDGPWIYVGGDLIQNDRKEVVPGKVREILRLARQEPDRESILRSATSQTTDTLRFLLGNIVSQAERGRTEALKARIAVEKAQRQKRILTIGAGVSILPVSGVAFLVISAILRRRPRRFPPILWTRRLGAPHAGGNNAIADLGRDRPSSPT